MKSMDPVTRLSIFKFWKHYWKDNFSQEFTIIKLASLCKMLRKWLTCSKYLVNVSYYYSYY